MAQPSWHSDTGYRTARNLGARGGLHFQAEPSERNERRRLERAQRKAARKERRQCLVDVGTAIR